MADQDDTALISKIETAFLALPQVNVLQAEDAERYLKGLMRWHKDRALWHLDRWGFGGSDMGSILRGLCDKYAHETGFNDVAKTIEHKLLKRLPDFQSEHMQRGTVLESLARRVFQYKYGCETDQEAMKVVGGRQTIRGVEWLQGEPDDLIRVSNKRYLLDYKVPNTCTDDVEFDYKAQLHHYRLRGELQGVVVDGMALVKLDLAPEIAAALVEKWPAMPEPEKQSLVESIANTNLKGFGIRVINVPYDKELATDIFSYGFKAWNEFVMQGIVPTKVKPMVELSDSQIQVLLQEKFRYATARSVVTSMNAIAADAAEQIETLLEGCNLDTLDTHGVIVSAKNKPPSKVALIQEALARGATTEEIGKTEYSEKALIAEIEKLGGDVDADYLKTSVHDSKLAEKFLSGKGFDVNALAEKGVVLRVSTAKEAKAIMETVRESVEPDIERLVESIAQTFSHTNDEDGYMANPEQEAVPAAKQSATLKMG